MTSQAPRKRVVAIAGVIALVLGLAADLTGLVNFATGWNLPALLHLQRPPDRPSRVISDYSQVTLPSRVFDFVSYNNSTRQSNDLDPGDARATAYAYNYWEDPESRALDATLSAGGITAEVVTDLLHRAESDGQRTMHYGPTTCVWDQDSDPNTPLHAVKCFLIDATRNRALITRSDTQYVGDIDGDRLTEEVWNLARWS